MSLEMGTYGHRAKELIEPIELTERLQSLQSLQTLKHKTLYSISIVGSVRLAICSPWMVRWLPICRRRT